MRQRRDSSAKYRVKLDLRKIRSNVLSDEGGLLTPHQIRQWLLSVGFTPEPRGTWLADRSCLHRLKKDEIVKATPVKQHPGVENPEKSASKRGRHGRSASPPEK